MQLILRNNMDRQYLFTQLEQIKYPYTVSVRQGRNRSLEQNNLMWKWFEEAAKQGDMTAEEYRAYCKLHIGVPILRNESESFRERYDKIVRPLDYETKMELMMIPFDFPVSRLMTTGQMTRFLDGILAHFVSLGFRMTIPLESAAN